MLKITPFCLALIALFGVSSMAHAQDKPTKPPVTGLSTKADKLARAANVAQQGVEADKTLAVLDTAAAMRITVQGANVAGSASQGNIIIVPQDPEWADVVKAVKAVSDRRKAAADAVPATP